MKKRFFYSSLFFLAAFGLHAAYSFWDISRVSELWVQLREVSPLTLYIERQEHYLGFSYALAAAFTTYAVVSFFENQRRGAVGAISGATLGGLLYFAGCFLLGCCGSPLLVVYLSLFGSSALGFTKPLTAMLTLTSVVIGYLWMERKTKEASCRVNAESRNESLEATKEVA
jgi:hypothetical protein